MSKDEQLRGSRSLVDWSARRPLAATARWVLTLGACVALAAGLLPGAASAVPPADGDRALAWGDNRYGQLGNDDSPVNSYVPVEVLGGANTANAWGTSWYSMDGGLRHACGVGADAQAYCWGRNNYGQLGNDDRPVDSSVPVQVLGGPASWAAVSVGNNSACGLGADDSAYCWGSNHRGQLGDGTNADDSVPVLVHFGANTSFSWESVRVGDSHACGIGGDDSAYCWGYNDYGQLGNGTKVDDSVPVLVQFGANTSSTWASVDAGSYHSCGLDDSGTAYCWGSNSYGQLGNGTKVDDSVPVLVHFGDNSSLTWKSVLAGYDASCGIGGDDSAYCWGYNDYGQLGIGTKVDKYEPVRVLLPAGVKVRMLAMDDHGDGFVCALSMDNVAYCWGYNKYGQLGNGTANFNGDDSLPVLVQLNGDLAGGTPRMIAVGGYSSYMVSTFTTPAPPRPPVFPPGAPRDVVGVAGDREVAVSWQPPSDSGSFPVTDYRVVASPGGASCLAKAPTLTCTVTGLTNGTAYTFVVTALNGAGWGAPSAASAPVTPGAPVVRSLTLFQGQRVSDGRHDRIRTAGASTGIPAGARLTPWIRYGAAGEFKQGVASIVVDDKGGFTWTRQIRKDRSFQAYVAFEDLESNRVIWRRVP